METAIKAVQAADSVKVKEVDTSYTVYNVPELSNSPRGTNVINVNVNSTVQQTQEKESDKFGRNVQMGIINDLRREGLFKKVGGSEVSGKFVDLQCVLLSVDMRYDRSWFGRGASREYTVSASCNLLDKDNNLLTSFNVDENKDSLTATINDVGQKISEEIQKLKRSKL